VGIIKFSFFTTEFVASTARMLVIKINITPIIDTVNDFKLFLMSIKECVNIIVFTAQNSIINIER